MFEKSASLLNPDEMPDEQAAAFLKEAGFLDWKTALTRLRNLAEDKPSQKIISQFMPALMVTIADTAIPDSSLINFERFIQCVDDREEIFQYLADHPRAIEILIKLFVGSQFLTEILLRHPDYLEKLTNHTRLAEFKSKQDFYHEAYGEASTKNTLKEQLDSIRRYQRWELLRIGACDSFGLLDLKTVTIQLSLMADSIVQSCMQLIADDLGISLDGFCVLGFGKLGGEELNYSSDIDLVFLSNDDATKFWGLGQKLIKSLMESSSEGFLYRVDMRLRPWGSSGALVNTVEAHLKYLKQHGMAWEKQALIKARTIAGDQETGKQFLDEVALIIYNESQKVLRESVRSMKEKIEKRLKKQGKHWGEVKSGIGSIRDIEFVTQYLQLSHGNENKNVRSISTLDGLVRLADFSYIQADEYRKLTSGYIFLRTIEHALQLMHHKQTHSLPEDPRELLYLARRLDYPDADHFLNQYTQHCEAIRAIYNKFISGEETVEKIPLSPHERLNQHLEKMEPSYAAAFSEGDTKKHIEMMQQISKQKPLVFDAVEDEGGLWKLTIVGEDGSGELSIICGLLFVYGFDIVFGNAFTTEHVLTDSKSGKNNSTRIFINVFTVKPPLEIVLPEVWNRYQKDLFNLTDMVRNGKLREAQGKLAKMVTGALRDVPETSSSLYPVSIEIDNDISDTETVLHIQAEDTEGFLYELANSLALAGIHISRFVVSSEGDSVFDTLYITDAEGNKIIDPDQQKVLRTTIVLIKHFTHILPRSPNPEKSLLHFREFIEQLVQNPNWVEELSSLENFEVLDTLSRLLGVSNFLWKDFLRLQHDNLFPLVKDVENLSLRTSRESLETELKGKLDAAGNLKEKQKILNEFKDREMFRTDLRHIMGHISEFGEFSAELTVLAEVIVSSACEICLEELIPRYGFPKEADGKDCHLSACALGKCGGGELGFASDIELMFIFSGKGKTDGNEKISVTEFYQKLVDMFMKTIQTKQEGIFQIDLRLRPYGRAGSMAVSVDAFESYFGKDGAAWPYEKQALVKLRHIYGDTDFGQQIINLRDSMIYTDQPFDSTSMRAMREKQILQLVQGGTINAKLSLGGLVDIEYLVQGLQITNGKKFPQLREPNTCLALYQLKEAGLISQSDHDQLLNSYKFQRQLIDALRMVRGHAKDLTVPPAGSEELEYLSQRLGYNGHADRFLKDLETNTAIVQDLAHLLDSDVPD